MTPFDEHCPGHSHLDFHCSFCPLEVRLDDLVYPHPPANHRNPLFHDFEVRRIRNHSSLEFHPTQRYLNEMASNLEARAALLELSFEDVPTPRWEEGRLGRSKRG